MRKHTHYNSFSQCFERYLLWNVAKIRQALNLIWRRAGIPEKTMVQQHQLAPEPKRMIEPRKDCAIHGECTEHKLIQVANISLHHAYRQ